MRWEELFADLEAQAEAEDRAELEAEVAERTRAESARLGLVDRLRGAGSSGTQITAQVRGGRQVSGRVARVGADWVLLDGAGVEVLVPLAAVEVLGDLGSAVSEPGSEGTVAGRLPLGSVLRAIARDRAEVRVTTDSGRLVVGTLERVGRDHVELTEHPPGEPRLRGSRLVVPYAALGTVTVST